MRRLALLLVPGLGQARNGQRTKALAVAFAALLLVVLGLFTPWIETPAGLASYLLLLLAGACASSWDVWRCRGGADPVRLRVVERVVMLAPLALVASLALPAVRRDVVGKQVFRIPAGNVSGAPALIGGDRFLARIGKGPVERGALALFEAPGEGGKVYVKRLVALAGDVVRGGADGIFVGEQRISEQAVEAFGPMAIGDGQAFFLGDNPCCSRDSRQFGPVPIDAIIGWPLFVVWGRTCDRVGTTLR